MIKTYLMAALLAMACAFAWQGAAGKKDTNPQNTQAKSQAAEVRHDHVGKPLPDYMTGDQCLFCHQRVVGPTWQQEPHAWTIREVGVAPAVPKTAADATHIIGSPQHFHPLKLVGYGKFALLAADGKTWQDDVFATKCAGCHTTGVDPKTHAFSAFAFDCFACHGDIQEQHTTDPKLALLSSKRPREPREIVSACGQCHLRGGRSQSTGLPYPNNFVVGDDLFADFKVDLKHADDTTLNAADRHVYTYTRNVVERGSKQTCMDCHRIHGDPALKHASCVDCEDPAEAGKNAKRTIRSSTCNY
ncbi:MAG TPA: cytochrome c3 family protein [Candidatus Angelobacter sp.]|jgi:hypothetical protein|nr:cytochrome c3 family protein [Candidatus Angelobacter sp.]